MVINNASLATNGLGINRNLDNTPRVPGENTDGSRPDTAAVNGAAAEQALRQAAVNENQEAASTQVVNEASENSAVEDNLGRFINTYA